MTDPKMPDSPFNSLDSDLLVLHEFFTSAKNAGFTEDQALYLTGQYIAATVLRGA